MASTCGKLSAAVTENCVNPLQSGAEDDILIINYDDWKDATITLNGTNTQIVENIVLPSGVVGYLYEGKNNSVAPKYEFIKGEFVENYSHEINYKVFNVSPEAKQQLEKKGRGRYVVIVANKYHGTSGNSAFEIYGADAGLELTQNIREVINTATGGAFDVILKSNEKSLEPHMPKTLFVTSYAASKAVFDSLD